MRKTVEKQKKMSQSTAILPPQGIQERTKQFSKI